MVTAWNKAKKLIIPGAALETAHTSVNDITINPLMKAQTKYCSYEFSLKKGTNAVPSWADICLFASSSLNMINGSINCNNFIKRAFDQLGYTSPIPTTTEELNHKTNPLIRKFDDNFGKYLMSLGKCCKNKSFIARCLSKNYKNYTNGKNICECDLKFIPLIPKKRGKKHYMYGMKSFGFAKNELDLLVKDYLYQEKHSNMINMQFIYGYLDNIRQQVLINEQIILNKYNIRNKSYDERATEYLTSIQNEIWDMCYKFGKRMKNKRIKSIQNHFGNIFQRNKNKKIDLLSNINMNDLNIKNMTWDGRIKNMFENLKLRGFFSESKQGQLSKPRSSNESDKTVDIHPNITIDKLFKKQRKKNKSKPKTPKKTKEVLQKKSKIEPTPTLSNNKRKKMYPCPTCGKKYAQPSSLRAHKGHHQRKGNKLTKSKQTNKISNHFDKKDK